MPDSVLLAIEGFAFSPFLWMLIKRWEASDMTAANAVIYPTPLMVRVVKIALIGTLFVLWASAIGDLLGW